MRNKFSVKYMFTTLPQAVLYPSLGERGGGCPVKYFQVEEEEEDGKQRK